MEILAVENSDTDALKGIVFRAIAWNKRMKRIVKLPPYDGSVFDVMSSSIRISFLLYKIVFRYILDINMICYDW